MAQSGISFAALRTILSKSESSFATFQRHNKNLKTYTQIKDRLLCSSHLLLYPPCWNTSLYVFYTRYYIYKQFYTVV